MKFIPRGYQSAAFDAAVEFLAHKKDKSGYMVLPTGTGKSFLIAMIVDYIRKEGGKVLVLQPSIELLKQNFSKYEMIGETKATIYSASISKEKSDCVYATLGSIKKLGKDFKALGITFVIVDECDSKYPETKGSMFSTFIGSLGRSKIKLLGLTATPYRFKSNLEQGNRLVYLNQVRYPIFKKLIYLLQIDDIREEYWSPLVYKIDNVINSKDLVLNSTGVSFTDDSVNKVTQQYHLVKAIREVVKHLQGLGKKRVLIFCPNIATVEQLTKEVANSAGVTSNTKIKDRKQLVEDFKSGKINFMFNHNIFSIGFDYPEMDDIVLGYPIGSFKRYYQVLGRGVRPHEDKPFCTIYDLTGNFERHGYLEQIEHRLVEGQLETFVAGKKVTNVRLNEMTAYEERLLKQQQYRSRQKKK